MNSSRRAFALILLAALAFVSPAQAALYLWDGGGNDNSMATHNNWATNSAPSGAGNHLLQFIGPLRPTPYNLGMMFLTGIDFPSDSNHTAFTLSGARLHVSTHGIQNWSGATQTINNDISLQGGAADHSFTGDSGTLVLDGDINLANGVMEVTGDFGEVQLNGEVTATSGGIDVGSGSTPGTLALGGSILTDVDVHAGTLIIDTDQPQPDYTTLQFQSGTSFEARGIHNVTQTFHLTGDVTFKGNGTLFSEAMMSGTGNLIVDAAIGATLGFGPANNISAFSGDVSVKQGILTLSGTGLVAQAGGDLDVGKPTGGPQQARVLTANAGVVGQGNALTVRTTGLVDLKGARSFSKLSLYGGDLVAGGDVSVNAIGTGASSRTASLDAAWVTPSGPTTFAIALVDGAANPDLRLLQGCSGSGTVRVFGSGEVEFDGVAADGPGALQVEDATAILDRTGANPALNSVVVDGGTLRTSANAQLAQWIPVDLQNGGTLDIGSHQESAESLTMEDGQVLGSGLLALHDDLTVTGDATIGPTLSFAIPSAAIDVEIGGTLGCGFVDGADVSLVGGGTFTPDEINCNLAVTQGTLRYTGLADGDLTIDDTLVLLRDQGWIVVNGALACGPNSTLNVQLDLTGAVAGDSWVLVDADSFDGSFGTIQLPAPPADHYLAVDYVGDEMILRLEAIELAQLDFKNGVNGQQGLFGEGLSGVAAVDFTPQGLDDVQLCSVTVDSLKSPLGDSVVAIRLYDVWTGTLLASTQQFFAQTDVYESRTFPLDVLLQPGDNHRLVVYGTGDLVYQGYYPNRAFPYFQSTLVKINGAYRDRPSADVMPMTPTEGFPQFALELGPCNLTAAPPVAPVRYELALNASPNPFNPQTTVSFEVPVEGNVDVSVFDARGRRVATLFDERRPAGRFDLHWDGRDSRGATLGSGVYFLKLSHPAGEKVSRVTLLK